MPLGLHFVVSGGLAGIRAQPSHRRSSLVEDQAVHVVGEVGEVDLGLGALDADGADEQPHLVFLPGKDMLDAGADLRFGGVCPGGALEHRLAPGLLAVDAADPALPLELCLVGLAVIGGIGPDVRDGVVAGDDIAEHSPVEGRAIGDLAYAD